MPRIIRHCTPCRDGKKKRREEKDVEEETRVDRDRDREREEEKAIKKSFSVAGRVAYF